MRCYQCMKEFSDEYEICPHCGYYVKSLPDVINHLYPGTVLADRYIIGVVVGHGGFGVVYKAWDKQLDHMVCIKEYFPIEFANRTPGKTEIIVYSGQRKEGFYLGLERFLDEAQNLAKFSKHENVVNVFDYFEENNTAYFVMEYLGKTTLKDKLLDKNRNRLSMTPEKTIEIGVAVSRALKAIHGEGIVHRDIAPDNIFVLEDGKIKLLDFGAARLSDRTDQSRFVTLKPGYAPPEQYRSSGKQEGPWTDIYALGATLYRAVTGIVPEESTDRVKKDDLKEPKEILRNMPEHLNTAIMRAMAININYRFQSAQELEDALLNKKKVLELQEEIKRRKTRRRRSLIASIMFLLVCLGILAYRINGTDADSLKGDIDVWICVDEGEDAQALKDYYSSAVGEVFSEDYSKVKVNIETVDAGEYSDKLLDAFEKGNAPAVFESTNVTDQVLEYAEDTKNIIDELIDGDESLEYYFIENESDDDKRIPIGYSVPVAYSIGKNYQETVNADAVEGSEEGRLTTDKISKLEGSEQVYLYGSSLDYEMVKKQIYGTYEEQKESVAGKLNISVIDGAEPVYTTTFSVAKGLKRKDRQAANIFVEYLVSYKEQNYLHLEGHKDGVDESDAFSVNANSDKEHRDSIRSAFSVLDDVMADYK